MKILIIDDDYFALKLISRQLANLGYEELLSFDNPHDAIRKLEEDHSNIDIVICDLQMPHLDGIEVIRHLAKMRYQGSLILISGEEDRILHTARGLAKASELNVLGILNKPVFLEILKSILNASIDITKSIDSKKTYRSSAIKKAISTKEIINFYQPKVELASGKVVGVEALARWQHPVDGLVLPTQFIGAAEQDGLIGELTEVVLTSALMQVKSWQSMGINLSISVNIPMSSLNLLDFPDYLAEKIDSLDIERERLFLEVTENQLIKSTVVPFDILIRLRLKKIGLAIDDFGTGHSSLAQVRDIPFNELKIDRSFVHGAWRDSSLRVILESTLGMAWQMDLKTVAEGVEDIDDWSYLRAAGCDLAQGFFIAPPMPASDIPEWMLEWKERHKEMMRSAQ